MRRAATLLLLATSLGCGAKTGLGLEVGTAAADAGLDASVEDRDAEVADAGEEVLACDGRPMPRPGDAVAHATVARMHSVGVLIPDPLGVILVGGLTMDAAADQMAFLDLVNDRVQELPVEGDLVALPDRTSAAVLVPEGNGQVVVLGGMVGGAPTDQVFSFTGEGDEEGLGLRRVITELLPPFPAGPVQGLVAIWDPNGRRVVAHGGLGTPDEWIDGRTTWSLELFPVPVWSVLVPAEDGPLPDSYAIGYDPSRNVAVELTRGDGGGVAVFELSLEWGRESWTQAGELDFAPSTRGELLYDPSVCGFHLLSARRTRCVLEHWILTEDAEAIYRADLELAPGHFLASSTFVAARDSLLVYGSEDCDEPVGANLVAHEIPLVR